MFKDGKMEGQGAIFNSIGQKIYEGAIKNFKREGQGIEYDENTGCQIYDGEWKADCRDGKGIQYIEDGVKLYEGQWKADKWEG